MHVDLDVPAAKEQELVRYFQDVFRPAAMKFKGYLGVTLLRLSAVPVGTAPDGLRYRFAITYESEELRQLWIASDIHQEVWGTIERLLAGPSYTVLQFDAL